MKLRNTRKQMVRIRRPEKRLNLEIGPLEVIDIDLRTRQALTPFLVDFGLKVEADDEDFHPNATLPTNINSTDDERQLHARQPVEEDEPTNEEMEELFFEKGVEETGEATTEESGTTEEPTSGGSDDIPTVGDTEEKELEELYTSMAEGAKENLSAEDGGLEVPENCPYTETELKTKVKSELWEICEKLGLSSEGTKPALVKRIIGFYVEG